MGEHWIAAFVGLVHPPLPLHSHTHTHIHTPPSSFLLVIFTKNQHILWYRVAFYYRTRCRSDGGRRLVQRKGNDPVILFASWINDWEEKKNWVCNYLLLVTTRFAAENAAVVVPRMLLIYLVCYIVISNEQNKGYSEVVSLIPSCHAGLSCNISVKLTNKRQPCTPSIS